MVKERTGVVSGERRRAALVINRKSRSADVDIGAIVDRMREGGLDVCSVAESDNPSDMTALARRAAEEADIVVMGGGDGTMSSVLPVFLKTKRILGVLPLGTANDLARSLDVPLDPHVAADVLWSGEPRPIDLGEVNGRPFCNAVSMGFAAGVAESQDPKTKRWLGVLEYPLSWIKAARESAPFAVTLVHDGKKTTFRSVFMLTVMNGRYHGRGMSVDERARIDDGMLKIYCVESANSWKLPLTFLSLQRGRLAKNGQTSLFRAQHVEISGKRPMPLNVDGDVVAETPATFRVLPAAISVMMPRRANAGETERM